MLTTHIPDILYVWSHNVALFTQVHCVMQQILKGKFLEVYLTAKGSPLWICARLQIFSCYLKQPSIRCQCNHCRVFSSIVGSLTIFNFETDSLLFHNLHDSNKFFFRVFDKLAFTSAGIADGWTYFFLWNCGVNINCNIVTLE